MTVQVARPAMQIVIMLLAAAATAAARSNGSYASFRLEAKPQLPKRPDKHEDPMLGLQDPYVYAA